MFFERDIKQVKSGEKTELIYTTVTGIKADLSGPQQTPEILSNPVADETSSEDTSSNDSDGDKKQFVSSARPRDESPNSRKVTQLFFSF